MLSSNPPSLTWDEASWGYNAYSIGTDLRDEFGRFLPLVYFESFGDYKPPVYAYLVVPFVKLLGLNEWAVRLPSALLGTLTIVLTYFLTKKIFYSATEQKKEAIALLSSGVLAISPWHILLSRAAFEANVATFFIVGGIYLFLVSLQKKCFLPFCVISFVISMYTFNTARVFVPFLSVFLFIKYFKTLVFKMRIQTFTSIVVGILIFLPLFIFLLTPQAKLRYTEVNIFSDPGVVRGANQQIENDKNAFWSKIIHNRRVGYSLSYIKHYFDNLSPQFLFIRGDGNPKFSIQDVGEMYIWEIPFFVMGILFLFRKKEGHFLIIPVWILLGLLPAGVARETPHALRIETILPTFQILTAYGLFHIAVAISNIKYKYLIFALFILFFIFNISYFLHSYFKHYPKEFSGEWQYGYKEVVTYVKENEDKYDKIYITEQLGRPYIYFLFHTSYPPQKFRKEAVVEKETAGFVHVRSFGKYVFKEDVNYKVDQSKENLYIDVPQELPKKIKVLKYFRLLNGEIAFVAYEKKIKYEKRK